VATIYGFIYVRPIARDIIEHELVADAVAGGGLFLIALIILTITAQIVAGRVQRSRMGALDRTVGIIFGLLRGAIIVSLAYMMYVWAVDEDDQPEWIKEAITSPYIIKGADTIRSIVPNDTLKEAEERVRATGNSIREIDKADQSRKKAEENFNRATGIDDNQKTDEKDLEEERD